MKRFVLAAAVALTLFVGGGAISTGTAHAVDLFNVCSDSTTNTNCVDCSGAAKSTDICTEINKQNQSKNNPIIDTLKKVINIISLAIGVAAVIILIISGLRFVLDGGDPKAVEQARSGIIYALVGIVATIAAQALVVFVLNRVT